MAGRWLTIETRPEGGVGEVEVGVAPARVAVDAPEVVGEDPPGLDAAYDVDAHVAVQRRSDVVQLHCHGDGDRGGLVSATRVEAAGDLPLLVEDVAALLDAARDEQVAEDGEQTFAVETGFPDLVERADRLGLTGDRTSDHTSFRHTLATGSVVIVPRSVHSQPWDGHPTGCAKNAAKRSATGCPSARVAVTHSASSREASCPPPTARRVARRWSAMLRLWCAHRLDVRRLLRGLRRAAARADRARRTDPARYGIETISEKWMTVTVSCSDTVRL